MANLHVTSTPSVTSPNTDHGRTHWDRLEAIIALISVFSQAKKISDHQVQEACQQIYDLLAKEVGVLRTAAGAQLAFGLLAGTTSILSGCFNKDLPLHDDPAASLWDHVSCNIGKQAFLHAACSGASACFRTLDEAAKNYGNIKSLPLSTNRQIVFQVFLAKAQQEASEQKEAQEKAVRTIQGLIGRDHLRGA